MFLLQGRNGEHDFPIGHKICKCAEYNLQMGDRLLDMLFAVEKTVSIKATKFIHVRYTFIHVMHMQLARKK